MEDTPHEDDPTEFELDPLVREGVAVNFVRSTHSPGGFTIDFAWVDPFAPDRAVIVARLTMTPHFLQRLVDHVEQDWRWYARQSMPPEARDVGTTESEEANGEEEREG